MALYAAVVEASSQRMTERVFVAAPAVTERILLGGLAQLKEKSARRLRTPVGSRGFVGGEARYGAQTGLVPVESGAAVQSAANRSLSGRERYRGPAARNRRVACLDLRADVAGVGMKRTRSGDHQKGNPLAGSGSSSKPAYCSPVSKVENAVKSLPTVDDVKKIRVGTLKSAVLQLQQNAAAAVNQAKSDFSSHFGTEDLGGRAVEQRQKGRGHALTSDARSTSSGTLGRQHRHQEPPDRPPPRSLQQASPYV